MIVMGLATDLVPGDAAVARGRRVRRRVGHVVFACTGVLDAQNGLAKSSGGVQREDPRACRATSRTAACCAALARDHRQSLSTVRRARLRRVAEIVAALFDRSGAPWDRWWSVGARGRVWWRGRRRRRGRVRCDRQRSASGNGSASAARPTTRASRSAHPRAPIRASTRRRTTRATIERGRLTGPTRRSAWTTASAFAPARPAAGPTGPTHCRSCRDARARYVYFVAAGSYAGVTIDDPAAGTGRSTCCVRPRVTTAPTSAGAALGEGSRSSGRSCSRRRSSGRWPRRAAHRRHAGEHRRRHQAADVSCAAVISTTTSDRGRPADRWRVHGIERVGRQRGRRQQPDPGRRRRRSIRAARACRSAATGPRAAGCSGGCGPATTATATARDLRPRRQRDRRQRDLRRREHRGAVLRQLGRRAAMADEYCENILLANSIFYSPQTGFIRLPPGCARRAGVRQRDVGVPRQGVQQARDRHERRQPRLYDNAIV